MASIEIQKVTRDGALGLISQHSGIPKDQLRDETLLGTSVLAVLMWCNAQYGKSIMINNPQGFTVGDILRELGV